MRQVPRPRSPIGVIGDGRVARHLTYYFHLLDIPTCSWSRRSSTQAPAEACAACDPVLLLIRDDAIVPFVKAWPALRAKQLVHCSGSLVTAVARAAHPLMTFGDTLYTPDVYGAMPFVLDRDDVALADLLGLPNHWFVVAPEQRAYYHALCVLAGNMSVLLWCKLFDEFQQRFGIPQSAAAPYLEQITANLLADPHRALTGPLVRRDLRTIAANIEALEGDPFQAVYAACARAYDQRA